MKYIGLYIRAALISAAVLFSHAGLAQQLSNAKVPVSLKDAFQARFSAPNYCIEKTSLYLKVKNPDNKPTDALNLLEGQTEAASQKSSGLQINYVFPTQLMAYCYAQIEEYPQVLQLLTPLLSSSNLFTARIRTLNILALEIPEEERPQFSNQFLLSALHEALQKIQQSPFNGSTDLSINLLFTISKLSIESNQYRDANIALEQAKELLKNNPNSRLQAWLAYYYGIYYEQINQQRLAISSLMSANKLSDKQGFTKLSGEVKTRIADMYQQKHRFSRAIDFASQRVELYMNTKNTIKQADSLIQIAILKRKNKENNQALIYLFNALELVQNKSKSDLLAHVFLELGQTYATNNNEQTKQKDLELAQKYLQNARYHFTQLNKPRQQIESLLMLAQLNIVNDDPALAILQLEKVLYLSTEKYHSLRVKAFEKLALSYEITGNHEQAILHFKNFHSLQNRIKERLFRLQQLQITEQLQLFEQTQQQKQLENENTELQKNSNRFRAFTYSLFALFILAACALFYTLINNKKLQKQNELSRQKLASHIRTKLPSQQTDTNHFNYFYRGNPLFYALVNVPFLNSLNELFGILAADKIEQKLGEALQIYFGSSVGIFQIRDNQILFISEQKVHQNAALFAQKIEQFFNSFAERHNLQKSISIGLVAFPFLNNASRAINPTRILNLSSLALFGASQIRESKKQSSWVELFAIDNLQPAFFDGDLWVLGQTAIKKGIVKINSSHNDHLIKWPELDK
ncbi:tetratricopeptide repeat protein [Psychromonas ossibalaenae]|uniref:tetratricopeptide repeat protein n=1 Tax=Psychromonas ossibalaenae TaxID=444922 RepID=UPI0003631DDE|nr:GGDEF domain-containing protein [Psychromonas ossibalaenae]